MSEFTKWYFREQFWKDIRYSLAISVGISALIAILLRVTKEKGNMKEYFCRACSHVCEVNEEGHCKLCGSSNTGEMRYDRAGNQKQRATPMRPELPQPTVWQQINYNMQFRLMKGFAMLKDWWQGSI